MVLEAAFDDSPTSDFDPYEANSDTVSGSTAPFIDVSKRARPFPLLGPLLGYRTSALVHDVRDIAARAPLIIRRPLTQDELDAVVTAVSKRDQIASWVNGNALMYAGYRWWSTQAEGSYPFWKMTGKTKMTPEGLFKTSSTPLTRFIVQQARLGIWIAAIMLPAYAIGGILGQSTMAAQQLTDPRMKNFLNDMKSEAAQRNLRSGMTREAPGVPGAATAQNSQEMQRRSNNGMTQAASTYQQSAEDYSSRTKKSYEVDSSPTTLSDSDASYTTNTASSSDSIGDPDRSVYDERPGYASRPETQSSWDKLRSQAGAKETAWDRVRRGSDQSPTSQPTWQSRMNKSDNEYAFSEYDEDKQLAKSEAQGKFDARIERERHGKDFDDKQGGKGFW